jgi:hypothetical protein
MPRKLTASPSRLSKQTVEPKNQDATQSYGLHQASENNR